MCVIFVYVFFFKQKTAYEMRISDWSSDVCSSDLGLAERGFLVALGLQDHRLLLALGLEDRRLAEALGLEDIGALLALGLHLLGLRIEIGRASCRERVCQYV